MLFMAGENVLFERDFTIPHNRVSYEIKAKAVFVAQNVEPIEEGRYHLDFTSRGKSVELWQPDKSLYSREQARQAAESAFNLGYIEGYAKSQIQSWIHTGGLY